MKFTTKKSLSLFALAAALGCGLPALSLRADDAPKAKPGDAAKPAEAKETTLTGTAKCAKCSLHEAKTCQAVMVVKEKDKEVKYWVEGGAAAKKLNEEVCGGEKANVTVTGKVSEKDGKKVIAADKES